MTTPGKTQPLNAQPFVDWFFENDGARRLAEAVGLDTETTRRVLAQGLPLQLQALARHAQTRQGDGQIAQAVAVMPPFPSVMEALSMGQGARDLERAGESLAPTLLGEQHTAIPAQVTGLTGANRPAVERLFHMTLPLLLSRLNWRDAAALRFLPLVGQSRRQTGAVLIPTDAAVQPGRRAVPVAAAAVAETVKRPAWWLWLLPLLLFLLLGGCLYGMYRTPDNIKPEAAPVQTGAAQTGAGQTGSAQTGTTQTGTAPEETATAPVNVPFTVTRPEPGSEVSANGFRLEGTGAPESTYTIWRGGDRLGTFSTDREGRWKTDVLDAAVPAGDTLYTFRDAGNNEAGSLAVVATGLPEGQVPVTVTAPEPGSDVPASGFAVQGTGAAGAVYTAYEDGANIGSVVAGPDGTWGFNVAGASAGPHTYTVLDARGNRVALVPVNVVAGAGSGECSDDLSISLGENATVSAPFRFGGRGQGQGYSVTVWRGTEQIGTRDVTLTGDCTWSYASDPGGKDGQPSRIRYEVRPLGQGTGTPAAGQVTLNVSGSGTNFVNGEYVGPTTK